MHAPNAALLIDFDNVTLGIQKDLTKELRTLLNSDIIKGKVAVQRAYADWRRYPQYIVSLSESSIDLIFAPAFGSSKKNATDIRLAIDAIELVFTRPEIGTFILLSGDSDFSTMVIKLKEYGKYVIGVGIRESASDLLIQNCDEYFSYNDLAGLTKEVDTPSIQRDPWELAGEAVAQMARNGDVMRSDRLKQVMQQIDSNFDERNAGFNRFSKFVVEAGQRGVLVVTKLDNGQFEVAPTAGGIAAGAPAVAGTTSRPAREGEAARDENGRRGRSRRGRGRGPERERAPSGRERSEEAPREGAPAGRTPAAGREPPAPRGRTADGSLSLARAFQLMTQALSELRAPVPHEALMLRMVALHGREDPLLEPGRFSRLLRQANDAEIADVRKVGEDEYEVTPHRTSGVPAIAAPAAAAAAAQPTDEFAAVTAPDAPAEPARSDNGQRLGLRFRRGSRGQARQGEIPLIGVVQMDTPAEPAAAAMLEAPEAEREPATRKPARARAPRKKAAKAAATTPATGGGDEDATPAPRAKRTRARPKKKAE